MAGLSPAHVECECGVGLTVKASIHCWLCRHTLTVRTGLVVFLGRVLCGLLWRRDVQLVAGTSTAGAADQGGCHTNKKDLLLSGVCVCVLAGLGGV